MKLILVRHGETAANRDGLGLGRADPPLTERGLRQAEAIAEMIAGRGAEEITSIYTSPLTRARETAAVIGRRLGLPAEPLAGLIEMDIGEMEGLTGPEMRLKHPGFLADWRSERAGEVRMPGGESLADLQERAWPAVETILTDNTDVTAVAVSHNFVIHALLCKILALPLSQFRQFNIDLASISIVEFRPQRTIVSVINETCHLNGLESQATTK